MGATLIIYGFFLRPRESEFGRALESIPLFRNLKGKLFTEVGKELLKLVGTYFLLNTLRVK